MADERDSETIAGVLDALPLGVWVARAPGGEFVYANKMFAQIMGMQARDDVAVGGYAAPYAICDREGQPYPEQRMPFVRALKEREVVMVDDLVIRPPDGDDVFVRAYARPVIESGQVRYIVIAFFDITREVHAEEAKRTSEDRALRAERMQSIGAVASGIAHDFNNLLAAIRILADLLKGDLDPEERRGTLDALIAATDAAGNLSRSLLAFAGHSPREREVVDVDELIRRLGRIFGYAIDKRVTFSLDLTSEAGVLGNATGLEQLMMNLIFNAEEAVSDMKSPEIVVRTRAVGDRCVIEVEDNGPGVAPELRDRIFEPYFSTKSHRDSGFGLSTVYGVARAHDGEPTVTDGQLGGALFRVSLPRVTLPPRAAGPVDEEPIERGTGCLLVVDDEAVLRDATETALRTLGYRTIPAATGAEALEIYAERSKEIDAIILDLSMPGLSGRQTFLRLKDLNPSIRVLLTTGHGPDAETQALIDLGVREFVEKPWSLRTLSSALLRVLRTV